MFKKDKFFTFDYWKEQKNKSSLNWKFITTQCIMLFLLLYNYYIILLLYNYYIIIIKIYNE